MPAAAKACLNESSELWVSTVSFWELATLTNISRIALEPDLGNWFATVRNGRFCLLNIHESHLLTYAGLPLMKDHRDPFDRLLIAQALTENLALMSRDAKFADYPVVVLW